MYYILCIKILTMLRSFFEAENFFDPDIDEKSIRDVDPRKMTTMIAKAKCQALLDKGCVKGEEETVMITCDQVVWCQEQIREKPVDRDQARGFLESYRKGFPAECINGICVHHLGSGEQRVECETSTVTFRPFPVSVLEEMISTGTAFTTAGAFSLTDPIMSKWVDKIEGTVNSVEGFPVDKIRDMISDLCPSFGKELAPKRLGDVKCVIFDMDGLLLDTERLYSVAQQKILDRFGITFTYEVKAMMMGRKAVQAAQIMIDHYGIGDKLAAEDFVKEREEILDRLFPESELLPGVERLLLHLLAHNVPMAIATGSHKRHYTMKTTLHRELFERVFRGKVVTGDMVKESKPNPEIFRKAFQEFGFAVEEDAVEPSHVLVFEDAPLGIQAAQAAGMNTVMVSEVAPGASLQPDQYLTNMFFFKPQLWGLPPL